MKTLVLSVSGMHCTGCADTIRSLLGLEDGVVTAVVSYEDGTARILYDPATTDAARLSEIIEQAGFSVSRPAG